MVHGGIYLRQKRNFCPFTVVTAAVSFVLFVGMFVSSLGGAAVAAEGGGVRNAPSETGSSVGQQEAVGTTEEYVNSSAMGGGQGDSFAEDDDITSDVAEGDVDPFPALEKEGKSEARGPSLEEKIEEQRPRRRPSSVQEPQAKVSSKRAQKRHRLIGAIVLAASVALLTAFFLRSGRRAPGGPRGENDGGNGGDNSGNGENRGRGEGAGGEGDGGDGGGVPDPPRNVNPFDF
ncbi:UNVERIFIED_CONTAM: dense granule protein GRA6 [Hammondia hammondi]|eukprot:XP_008886613.1 dense granule protein GRA6 [Hammondia hammondi]